MPYSKIKRSVRTLNYLLTKKPFKQIRSKETPISENIKIPGQGGRTSPLIGWHQHADPEFTVNLWIIYGRFNGLWTMDKWERGKWKRGQIAMANADNLYR